MPYSFGLHPYFNVSRFCRPRHMATAEPAGEEATSGKRLLRLGGICPNTGFNQLNHGRGGHRAPAQRLAVGRRPCWPALQSRAAACDPAAASPLLAAHTPLRSGGDLDRTPRSMPLPSSPDRSTRPLVMGDRRLCAAGAVQRLAVRYRPHAALSNPPGRRRGPAAAFGSNSLHRFNQGACRGHRSRRALRGLRLHCSTVR